MKANEPVTVLFNRTTKPGKEQAYEAWNKKLIRLSEAQPGHIMTSVVADGNRRYFTLQRFETHSDLQRWLQAPERLECLQDLDELTEDAPEPAEMTGMETWFRLPGQSGKHIPRWKMVIVTFCVIYCFVLLLNIFLVPKAADLPLLLRAAVFPVIMVPLMTYVVMPRITRWFGRWLYSAN
jgi:uncharacterized protein